MIIISIEYCRIYILNNYINYFVLLWTAVFRNETYNDFPNYIFLDWTISVLNLYYLTVTLCFLFCFSWKIFFPFVVHFLNLCILFKEMIAWKQITQFSTWFVIYSCKCLFAINTALHQFFFYFNLLSLQGNQPFEWRKFKT